ncbi:MAG: TVP38/TMEM64 family protein [Planctomycetaceae bacterium]|nr:TVP38/TMEM64 family protein [Planctomycetaceae bacterium]
MNDDAPEPVEDAQPARIMKGRPWLGFLVLGVLVIVVLLARPYLDRHELAQWGLQQEQQLQQWLQLYPVASWLTAFGIYVLVAGLALPIAVFVSLFYGWWLGFWSALVLVSFASTAGASVSFLLSRTLLGDLLQRRYPSQLAGMNRAFEAEGAFYLFSLRLMPYIPFFLVNLLMGLTPIRLKTFWWVSQVGMLPGTMIYIYAGSAMPSLFDLVERPVNSLMSTKLLVAFVLIGLFPLAVKRLWQRWGPAHARQQSTE